MRKAGEQVRQQSKRKMSVKACKRATTAILRLFPHHAAFDEGRAAPGKAPGKHLVSTWQQRSPPGGHAVESRRGRSGQDAGLPRIVRTDPPGRKLTAPCCLASPIAPTLWLIHQPIPLPSCKNTQKHAETCKRDPFPCRRNLLLPRQRPEPISTTAASQSMKTASHSKLVTPLSRAVEFHIGRVLVSNR